MIETEPPMLEENLVSLLIACDEALAAGESPTSLCDVGARSRSATAGTAACVACLSLLHRFWPRRGSDQPPESVDDLAQSGSSTNRIGRFSILHESWAAAGSAWSFSLMIPSCVAAKVAAESAARRCAHHAGIAGAVPPGGTGRCCPGSSEPRDRFRGR